jgi:hypothetical protein
VARAAEVGLHRVFQECARSDRAHEKEREHRAPLGQSEADELTGATLDAQDAEENASLLGAGSGEDAGSASIRSPK